MKIFEPKLISSLKQYSGKQLASDLVAGLIVAIIALPLSIALAIASGVSPEKGLYTAIVAGFVIALFGGSRVNISGPTAAFATIVAGIVATYGISGLALATVMAGALLILAGVCRLGSLIKYIPLTITTGFTSGIALTIVIGQIKDFLGLTFAPGTHAVETLEKLQAIGASITTFNWQALVVGLVSLAVLIFFPKLTKKIPASLIAVVVGILMVKLLPLEVNTIGDLYTITSTPPTFTPPAFSLEAVTELFPSAVTIAVLAAIESLLSCVVSDGMIGDRHNSNTELIAQGLGNVASGLFGGIPATGAIARTAANVGNGGRSPISGMVHAVVLFLILVILMPFAAWIPMPTIAAVLFIVAYNMCEWRRFVSICKKAPASDILVLVLTFLLTVIFDLVVAIEVGLIVTAFLFMKRMADAARVREWKSGEGDAREKPIPPATAVFEMDGPMFFAATDRFADIHTNGEVRTVILRMRSVPSLDISALRALEGAWETLSAEGVTVIFSHIGEAPLAVMRHAGFVDRVGEECFVANIDEALAIAEKNAGVSV